MNLDALAAEIHQNNVEHGFHEKPVVFGDKIALIGTELSEAMEEYRKFGEGEMMLYDSCGLSKIKPEFQESATRCQYCGTQIGCDNMCGYGKPEGIASELCDAAIRILDDLVDDGANIGKLFSMAPVSPTKLTFGEFITELNVIIGRAYIAQQFVESRDIHLKHCLDSIIYYLKYHSFDPEETIRLKMAFNHYRPYKHGKLL